MNPAEIEETIKCHVQAKIDEYDIDATIIDAVVVGSRCRGLEKDSSDLDVVVELSTNEREDDLFNAFNEDGLHIGEVKVDINPITAQRTGTLETYLPQAEKYLESIRQEREQELTQQMQTQGEMEKEEVEVTLMVSECGEFHNLGEFMRIFPLWRRQSLSGNRYHQSGCMVSLQSVSMFTDRAKKSIWMMKLTCYQVTGLIWRY